MAYPLLQIDPLMYGPIQKYGCFFSDILAAVECFADHIFAASDVNRIWDQCISQRFLQQINLSKGDSDYYITNQNGIGDHVLNLVGLHDWKFRVIGSESFCEDYTTWGADHTDPRIDFGIRCGRTSHGNTHFRLADNVGVILYDPDPLVVITGELRIDWIALLPRTNNMA